MAQPNDIKKAQRELVRKKRRGGIRLILTLTLLVLGTILIVGIVVGTFLDLGAFTSFVQYKDQIHEFTKLLFTTCVGLLCLVLGFERLFDFDKIEETLEKQNDTLRAQNIHLENSAAIINGLTLAVAESSANSNILALKTGELISKTHPPTVLKDIDFKLLINQADEIDFLVQGWDGWMEHHSTELEEFFRRGGKFSLFVVNAQGDDAAHVRELMEKRLEKTASQVEAEINDTILNIRGSFEVADEPSSKKVLEVFCLNEVNWYFAAQFKSQGSDKRDAIVLSLYSHHRYHLRETPAIILYRDSAQSVFKWFDAELKKLEGRSTKLSWSNDVRND